MLKRLINWFSKNKKWNQEHKRSWNGMDVIINNNLSCFQELCETKLLTRLENNNIKPRNREICGSDEFYITGLLGNTELRYYMYIDGAEIDNISFEKWDYMTPNELCDKFISTVIERIMTVQETG